MVRSTCATLFAFALAVVLVTSLQSAEAKDRRCQPRCCPQQVYCQPQPACCQPAPTCCHPRTTCCATVMTDPGCKADVPYYCAYFQYAEWGGVYYYYAPHCPDNPMSYTPVTFTSTVNDPFPGEQCANDTPTNSTWCVHEDNARLCLKSNFKGGAEGKLRPKKKPNGPSSNKHYKRELVEKAENDDDPYFVRFRVPGITDPIVAQVWQWDVRPKNPKYPAVRFGLGQQVDMDATEQGVGDIEGVPHQIADFVYDVWVTHQNPDNLNQTYRIKYRVVIAEDQRKVLEETPAK